MGAINYKPSIHMVYGMALQTSLQLDRNWYPSHSPFETETDHKIS